MAAVLRSSLGKTVRRALLSEGNPSLRLPQQRWRLLHAGRIASRAHAKPFLKPPKVDPLVNKIDEVSRKAALVEYTQSLVQEDRTVSPSLLGIASQWFLGVCCIGLFTAGYHVGFHDSAAEDYEESGRK